MRLFLISVLIGFIFSNSFAQRDTLGRYSPGFKFKDGLYMSFSDFKGNCPDVPKDELFTENRTPIEQIDTDMDWYRLVNDSLIPIIKDSVWGFSSSGKIYLRNQDFFDRMVVIGSLCHIVHREEFIDYSNAMYNGFTYAPMRREVQTEFFLDLNTGEKKEFNEQNLSEHLKEDPVLGVSYNRLSRKKRKESKFRYLHSFNQNNPVYFPISRCRK